LKLENTNLIPLKEHLDEGGHFAYNQYFNDSADEKEAVNCWEKYPCKVYIDPNDTNTIYIAYKYKDLDDAINFTIDFGRVSPDEVGRDKDLEEENEIVLFAWFD